jgi:hypothetical protein
VVVGNEALNVPQAAALEPGKPIGPGPLRLAIPPAAPQHCPSPWFVHPRPHQGTRRPHRVIPPHFAPQGIDEAKRVRASRPLIPRLDPGSQGPTERTHRGAGQAWPTELLGDRSHLPR